MDNRKRLAYAIIQFLHGQLRHGGLSCDAQESLEVAIQCLETAFGVTLEDSDLALPQTLPEIFEAATSSKEMPQDPRAPDRTPPSEEDSAEAERLKTEGHVWLPEDAALDHHGPCSATVHLAHTKLASVPNTTFTRLMSHLLSPHGRGREGQELVTS